jgi:uncharacterized protein (DUF1697 family)
VSATSTCVALIRGINVGGRNKISMAELTSVFESLGHEDVATFIQSGNVVFRSGSDDEAAIARRIEKQLADDFGLDVSVLLRTPSELSQVAGSNPFLAGETDLSRLHVLFLDILPAASAVAGLDPSRSAPDRFSVHGREIYDEHVVVQLHRALHLVTEEVFRLPPPRGAEGHEQRGARYAVIVQGSTATTSSMESRSLKSAGLRV